MSSIRTRWSRPLSEPEAGTDLQSITTTARRDGDTYYINGSKMWVTNGRYGQIFLLLAKTEPAAQPAHRGIRALSFIGGDADNGRKRFLQGLCRRTILQRLIITRQLLERYVLCSRQCLVEVFDDLFGRLDSDRQADQTV